MIDKPFIFDDILVYFDPKEYGYTLSIQGNINRARAALSKNKIPFEDLDDQLLVEFVDLLRFLKTH